MGIAKDSTDFGTTSSDWPIPQIQNWHKCCLLDAFFVIPPLNVSGIVITWTSQMDRIYCSTSTHPCLCIQIHTSTRATNPFAHLRLNCSHPLLASFTSVSQLLCKWETEILWQPDVVTGSVAGDLWISACPAIRQCCHSTQGAKEENVTRWELLRRNHASKSPGATGPPQTHQSDRQAGWSCWSF